MRKVFLMGVCLMLTVTSIGCGTIRGIGEDISAVGGWLIKGVEGVKEGE